MSQMTEKKQEKLDQVVSNLKRLSKELGKPNLTISDCRSTGGEYSISWVRRECGLSFNGLKELAGLPINDKGGSSYGKRGVHTMVKNTGGMRPCNKCNNDFQRTNINRAICPKCSGVNAQESDNQVSLFSSGRCSPKKGGS